MNSIAARRRQETNQRLSSLGALSMGLSATSAVSVAIGNGGDGMQSFHCRKLTNISGNAVALRADFARVQVGHPHRVSHSGLLEPRGTSTVLKDPGVFDKTTWSVMP
jgi:hypothetical protein